MSGDLEPFKKIGIIKTQGKEGISVLEIRAFFVVYPNRGFYILDKLWVSSPSFGVSTRDDISHTYIL